MVPLAVPLALGLDAVVGEPPRRLHPVAWFGSLVAPADRDWARPGLAGLSMAVIAPLVAALLIGFLVGATASHVTVAGAALAAVVLFVTTSWRRLSERARSVVDASEANPQAARSELPALVGRDPSALSPGEIRGAAVESAAENLGDGLVAPLLAFGLGAGLGAAVGPAGALALGAGAAVWVKAVNTLDSMVGYPDKPHGSAAARLDDAVMWVPARVAAVLLALAGGRPGAIRAARRWLDGVPSPNAGWPMGAVAAVADCQLDKPGVYVLNEPADLPSVETARSAIRTVAVAGLAAYALAALIAGLGVLAWS